MNCYDRRTTDRCVNVLYEMCAMACPLVDRPHTIHSQVMCVCVCVQQMHRKLPFVEYHIKFDGTL